MPGLHETWIKKTCMFTQNNSKGKHQLNCTIIVNVLIWGVSFEYSTTLEDFSHIIPARLTYFDILGTVDLLNVFIAEILLDTAPALVENLWKK